MTIEEVLAHVDPENAGLARARASKAGRTPGLVARMKVAQLLDFPWGLLRKFVDRNVVTPDIRAGAKGLHELWSPESATRLVPVVETARMYGMDQTAVPRGDQLLHAIWTATEYGRTGNVYVTPNLVVTVADPGAVRLVVDLEWVWSHLDMMRAHTGDQLTIKDVELGRTRFISQNLIKEVTATEPENEQV
jgi:hypothetical protein